MTRLRPPRGRLPAAGAAALVLILLLAAAAPPEAFSLSPPRRIVSLAPNITEILFALGLKERVVGVTTFCDHPPAVLRKKKVGGFSNPSLEAVIAAGPDAVIVTEDGNPPEIAARLKRAGIAVYVFRARKIAELPGAVRDMGRFLGVEGEARRLAASLERSLRDFAASAAPRRRAGGAPALFVIQPEPLIVAGKRTIMDDAMSILGLTNIAADAPGFYPKYSLEETIRRQPRIVFIGQTKGMDEDVRRLLKRLATLPAVREGRVFTVRETLFRLGPRIVEGLEEMKRAVEKSGL
ncbi:MAG TPA: helical backbone metal receptor [Syntrophales bacterium]|nr:helical backbone metal receptor [Syntrophales bacterium]HOM06962.1 helical backbone metal receptor [Syntrophales bacterium]HPC00917.1 helical backbone metal receptor [Syntrophales bacterium]HPQ06503.1 helical backbone metal receptor [Syntrophales bacterium]HRV42382.1 helical backbone metal receptor [Syntrophales bacterium]